MEKKKWSCAFLDMNTLVHRVGALLAVSTLLVLGTSTPVKAKCDGDGICERGENAKNCPADCTAGGDPPPAGQLTANLSGGTFVFHSGPKPVVLNAMENTATSEENVELTRPVGDPFRTEWDCVFAGDGFSGCEATGFDGCDLLETPDTTPLTELMYGDDNWRINFGDADSGGIRVVFIDSLEDGVNCGMDCVEIRLQLIGATPNYVTNPIPPEPSGISQFCLDDFILAGDTVRGIRPRETCQPGPGSGGGLERFPLTNKSTLTICGAGMTVAECLAVPPLPSAVCF